MIAVGRRQEASIANYPAMNSDDFSVKQDCAEYRSRSRNSIAPRLNFRAGAISIFKSLCCGETLRCQLFGWWHAL